MKPPRTPAPAPAPAPEQDQAPEQELNIVTLNCWGLKYISSLRSQRISEIGRRLASSPTASAPHIVALQEIWCRDDYESVRRQVAAAGVLPYAKFYHGGSFGAGLAVLSRWPIEESSYVRYPLNGRPTAFWRGDWFVGKGVACARIRYGPGPGDVVDVFNTHTHAPYTEGHPQDTYLCHRLSQSWEFSKLIRRAAASSSGGGTHLAVGLGDFNATPSSLPYRLLVAGDPAEPSTPRDAWRALHPDSALGPAADDHDHDDRAPGRPVPVPTAGANILLHGATSDSALNTWRWPRSQQRQLGRGVSPACWDVPPDAPDPRGKRLDHVFVANGRSPSSPSSSFSSSSAGTWTVASARVGMIDRHPTLECSLSDHFSVEVRLVRQRHHSSAGTGTGTGTTTTSPRTPEEQKEDEQVSRGTYLQSPAPSLRDGVEGGPRSSRPRLDGPLTISEYDRILAEIRRYAAREETQRRWRGRHFFAWVAVLVACLVGVWWSPHNYVSFVLLLVCSLGLVAGTIDGLIALLFIGSELRALKEFEWEVSNARAALVTAEDQPFVLDGSSEKQW